MTEQKIHAVTGAFGYSGKYIAQRLLEEGQKVITLTNSPNRGHHFGESVKAIPYNFDNPDRLVESLKGVTVLYITYWVRFNHNRFKYIDAVENTKILFKAAKNAGIERIVHVSISNPSEDSDLEYFRGKAALERAAVIIVIAGMEGALASVVSGLVSKPVIGVPTSVGYGAGQGGIAPLLTMLNSCAAGVSVVNIDNGFGAGYIAAIINRQSK